MRFFKRRSVGTRCSFCGKGDGGSRLTELCDTAYGKPHGYYCGSCEELYFQLESRLTYTRAPGHRPWLVPDSGTEHVVKAASDPFDAVHAVVGGLEEGIMEVPRAAARIAALRLGLYGAGKVTSCDSRAEAIAEVSRTIAEGLAKHHELLQEYFEGRDYSVHTVSLFGRGCGVLLQRVTTEGSSGWSEQSCFLFDTDHSIHRYTSYER